MSDDSGNSTGTSGTQSVGTQLEQACSAFEAELRVGKRPPVRDYLVDIPPTEKWTFLCQLLYLDHDYRSKSGEQVDVEEYKREYPEFADLISAVFRRIDGGSAQSDTEGPCVDAENPHSDAASPKSDDSQSSLKRIRDYELLEKVGQGGMGVVYKARHTRLKRLRALKVLPESLFDHKEAVERFQLEVENSARLEHPNIVQALDAGEENGTLYLVMEFVDGSDFLKLIRTHKTEDRLVPWGAACELIRQAAVALQHTYDNFVVHRDIKPSNLMLDESGRVKLLDLGLARVMAEQADATSHLTKTQGIMGSCDYMAPEQWDDAHEVDTRADIYGLGCTLFHLLALEPPFPVKGTGAGMILKKRDAHCNDVVPSLSDYRDDVPDELQVIVERMMAKNAEDRFSTPGQVADALGCLANARELSAVMETGTTIHDKSEDPTDPLTTASKRTMPSVAPQPMKRVVWCRKPSTIVGTLAAMMLVTLIVWGLVQWFATLPGVPPRRAQMAAEVCALPGLSGEWWFTEMPWLLPFVREAIAQRLTDEQESYASLGISAGGENPALNEKTSEAEDWLKTMMDESRGTLSKPQRELLDAMVALSEEDLDDQSLAVSLTEALEDFENNHGESSWNAADRHTLAVLYHRKAQLENNRETADLAQQNYRRAQEAYEATADGSSPLLRLCLLDLAWLYIQVIDDDNAMMACFDDALLGNPPRFVEAHVLTTKGMAECSKERYEEGDESLERADTLLHESEDVDYSWHPYMAHIHERRAWSLIYQWKVEPAAEHFKEAFQIRNAWQSQTPLAKIYALHNQHGLAMAERYGGKLAAAKRGYDGVLDDVRADLARLDREEGSAANRMWLRSKLQGRLYNTSERRADCELYQGAASNPELVDLEQACTLYESARQAAPSRADEIVMSMKLVIALALKPGDTERNLEEARKAFDAGRLRPEDTVANDKKRIRVLSNIADAVLALKTQGYAAGQEKLRGILGELSYSGPNRKKERDRCEVRELYLFCAELLWACALNEDGGVANEADIAYLGNLLNGFFAKDPDALRPPLRPYLLRYHEVAIEAADPNKPRWLADYIESSRWWKPQTEDALEVLFFLPEYFVRAPRNMAVLRSSDGECTVYELPFGRRDLLDGRNISPDAKVSDLLQRIERERQAGRRVEICFGDEDCWPDGSPQVLHDEHWPFEEIELRQVQPSENLLSNY